MWSMESTSEVVSTMKIDFTKQSGKEFRILVTSDRHLDSTHSDLAMQKKHLNEAKANNWPVIDLGDVFDAMQGRKDPRASRLELKKILQEKEEYFDSVVDYGEEQLLPWTKQFAMITLGNHETSIMRHNETNLIRRLVKRLNNQGGNIIMGPYAGWMRLMFTDGTRRKSFNIRHTHGHGGAAPVTKGVIQTNRRAVAYPDADFQLSGHTHEGFIIPITQERISQRGEVRKAMQWHVSVPSYKDSTTNLGQGFGIERGFMPTPVGAVWLKFKRDRERVIVPSVELAL